MDEGAINNIVDFWRRNLMIEDWDIMVDFGGTEDGEEARCTRMLNYDRAEIAFADPDYKTWSVKRAHEIVCHELLHIVTRDLDQAFDSLRPFVHGDVWSIADERYSHEIEGAVDRLACRLVSLAGVV